jgi:hypothetical protein
MENQSVRLDNTKLRNITNASHTSVVTMLLLALRERARGFSNIDATKDQLIRMGEKIVEEDFQKFWKDLQDAGIGVIVYGRRGGPDRFQWHYSLKRIAGAAIEGKENEVREFAKHKQPKRVQTKKAPVVQKRSPKKGQGAMLAKKLYSITLQGGAVAELIVQSDLSASDLDKIKSALTR